MGAAQRPESDVPHCTGCARVRAADATLNPLSRLNLRPANPPRPPAAPPAVWHRTYTVVHAVQRPARTVTRNTAPPR